MKKLYLSFLFLLSITIYAQPTIGTPQDLFACNENGNGYTTFDLSMNDLPVLGSLSPDDYTVGYFQTNADAQQNINALPVLYNNSVAYNETVYVRVTEIEDTDNFTVADFNLIVISQFEIEEITSFGYDIIVTTNAPGFEYTLSSGSIVLITQDSNIFTDIPEGMYTIRVEDNCGNVLIVTYNHALPPPTAQEAQTFTEGETLADLEIEGQNLRWYASATSEEVLPLTTPLVNNTTYYVSQTVNGAESARIGVTVSYTLSTNTIEVASLTYFPNPVKNNFILNNTTAIDNVSVYNTLGQLVFIKSINNTKATIDFSALENGIYFVEIQTAKSRKTIRVVKQ